MKLGILAGFHLLLFVGILVFREMAWIDRDHWALARIEQAV